MTAQRITPASRDEWLNLRAKDITSTESAMLFGLSPYGTEFSLWHEKKSGEIGEFAQTERMELGLVLEETIARYYAEQSGIKIRKLNLYVRDPDIRMGASFDFEIIGNEKGPGVMEVKNVDRLVFKNNWAKNEDGTYEAPPHIEMQVQHQLAVLNRSWGIILALIGGNEVIPIVREADPELGTEIRRRIAGFWASIEDDAPPAPNYRSDSEFIIKKLYGISADGVVADLRGDEYVQNLMTRYQELGVEEKLLDGERMAIKAEVLTLIDDAEIVILDGGKISAKTTKDAVIPETTRKGYRGFRYTPKKEK